MQKFKKHNNLTYYQTAKTPELLLISGLHGDEYEVIDSVRKALTRYRTRLSGYIYIDKASPSAIARKTRRNKNGLDINRHFFDDTLVYEVRDIQSLLSQFHFSNCITFHEDVEKDEFYLYDMGSFLHTGDGLSQFKKALAELGVPMLTGIDDEHDPILGYDFIEGHHVLKPGTHTKDNGTLELWILNHVISQQVLVAEVPGKVASTLKDKIVDAFFREIIIPLV